MNIFIITLGTRGDVQPYIALGLGLQKAGHQVTLCTTVNFRDFVTEHGLRYGYLNDDALKLIHTDAGRSALDDDRSMWKTIKTYAELTKLAAPMQAALLEEGWQAAEAAKPDLILFHPKGLGASHYAEKLGIPSICALLIPMLVPTREFSGFGFPEWKLGGWYNRLTTKFTLAAMSMGFGKYVDAWRKKHGMPRRRSRDFLHTSDDRPIPVMHGFSPNVVPRPADWPDHVTVTGYWFLDKQETWSPPSSLVDFLNAGDPPIYIGFGSMTNQKTERVSRVVVGALQKAKVRGILATGWGGLEANDLPDSIYKIDAAPHDWLFPRMAAVVHHGGAGTTAAGLRAGRPTLICPFFGDQPFWGRRVQTLGAGPAPIPPKKLAVDNLAKALRELVENEALRRNAEAIGEKLRQEDSMKNTLAFIEQSRLTP
ncbi:MAG: glycosyltransferase family 1 protein [Polyangiaceae bacterium]|nr:glycosyltransferase family 1 protein [Polyangiaceae bacterium]